MISGDFNQMLNWFSFYWLALLLKLLMSQNPLLYLILLIQSLSLFLTPNFRLNNKIAIHFEVRREFINSIKLLVVLSILFHLFIVEQFKVNMVVVLNLSYLFVSKDYINSIFMIIIIALMVILTQLRVLLYSSPWTACRYYLEVLVDIRAWRSLWLVTLVVWLFLKIMFEILE